MQNILTCAMGLDIHRDIIVACLIKGNLDVKPEPETRSFNTRIPWRCDWQLYKERHLVECFFFKLKHFIRVATI